MKPGAWWPAAVIGVLAATVVANAFLLYEASGPGAAVVEPDYYRKAVAWDSTLAQQARDQALGWRLTATLGPLDARGVSRLFVTLADAGGRPLAGAAIRVEAVHNRDAGHPRHAVLAAVPGGYGVDLPLAWSGLWELRFEARHAGRLFTAVRRGDVGR
jgi:hypothetical protein